jgi:hypothetical protein
MPTHRVEIDQSGKLEDTRVATVVAFSDGIHRSVLIPARAKRECVAFLRASGRAVPTALARLFAVALYFLLRDQTQEIALAIVDVEYTGHDQEIKQHLLNLLRRSGRPFSAERVSFQHIGKKSPAHELAIETLRGKLPPDRVVTIEELLAEM